MEQAEKLIARANEELGAAAALAQAYPVQAMEMMAAAVGTALAAACNSGGFDFERGSDPAAMIRLVPEGAWARTVEREVAVLLSSCEALLREGKVEGDFRRALELDLETAAAFLCDVEDYVRMAAPMLAAMG